MTGFFLSSSTIFHARPRIGPGGDEKRRGRRTRARARAKGSKKCKKWGKKKWGISICGRSKTESKWDSETSLWRYADQSARRWKSFLHLLEFIFVERSVRLSPQSAKTIIRKNVGSFERDGTRRRIVKIIRTWRVSRWLSILFFSLSSIYLSINHTYVERG